MPSEPPYLEHVQRWIKADKRRIMAQGYSAEDIHACLTAVYANGGIERYELPIKQFAERLVAKISPIYDLVHSVRYRTKDPDHLIGKLVRKCLDPKQSRNITSANLFDLKDGITDLGGVRIIHLYRHQWREIHRYLTSSIPGFTLRKREAYIPRDEDRSEYISRDKREGFLKKEIDDDHPADYTSLHYTFECGSDPQPIYFECQVRTIFEEGWGEIDHQYHYPEKAHKVVDTQLKALQGSAQVANKIAAGLVPLALFVPWKTELKYERAAAKVYVLSRDLAWAVENIDDWRINFSLCETQYYYFVPDNDDATLAANEEALRAAAAATAEPDRLHIQRINMVFFEAPFFSDVLLLENTFDWKEGAPVSLLAVVGTPTKAGAVETPHLDMLIRDEDHVSRLFRIVEKLRNAPRGGS